MIDLQKEKACGLTMQQRYSIISNAIDVANEGGFLNEFTMSRVICIFAAAAWYDLDVDHILENPLAAWDEMLQDGTLEKMVDEHKEALEDLTDEAYDWFMDYGLYLRSIRGAFGDVSNFMQDMMDSLSDRLGANGMEEIANVLKLADDWGMNNAPKEE